MHDGHAPGQESELTTSFFVLRFAPLLSIAALCVSQASCSPDDSAYKQQFLSTEAILYADTDRPATIADNFSSAWDSALRHRMDVDAGIARMKAAMHHDDGTDWFASLEADRRKANELMAALASPPGKYQTAHAKLVELYGTYERLCELASNPHGTYQGYRTECDDLEGRLKEEDAQIKAFLPKL